MGENVMSITGMFGGIAGLIALAKWAIEKGIIERRLETLRNELKKQAVEHEVRYRKVHEKVAEAFAGVFLPLSRLQKAVDDFAFVLECEPERRKEAAEALGVAQAAFKDACIIHRLFLPTQLYKQLKEYDDLSFRASMNCIHAVNRGNDLRTAAEEKWQEARQLVQTTLPKAVEAIHADFQRLLGYAEIIK